MRVAVIFHRFINLTLIGQKTNKKCVVKISSETLTLTFVCTYLFQFECIVNTDYTISVFSCKLKCAILINSTYFIPSSVLGGP